MLLTANLFAGDNDSLDKQKNFSYKFSVSGQGIHLFEKANAQSISQRINYNLYEPISDAKVYQYVKDNPLKHSCFYTDFNFGIKAYGLDLNFDLIAEHRGVSYGVFDTKSMIVFPKYYVGIDTSVTVGKQKIYFGTNFGNYSNQTIYEGLQIYNMDYQAIDIYIKWSKFRLRYHQIGDLSNYIGLKIDEVFNFILSAEDLKLTENYNANLQFGLASVNKIGHGSDPNLTTPQFNCSANVRKENLKLYAQYTHRDMDEPVSVIDESGFLAGISYNLKKSKFTLNTNAEYRFYGKELNRGYIDKDTHYRGGINYYDSLGRVKYKIYDGYDNTIGDNLYPLSFYQKKFSQWAVYTEYQNKNVNAFNFTAEAKYRIYNDFYAKADLDINFIKAETLDLFCYPFYNIGIAWEPADRTSILLSLTNKGMNLDKHYPTFYLYDSPQFMLSVVYDISVKN